MQHHQTHAINHVLKCACSKHMSPQLPTYRECVSLMEELVPRLEGGNLYIVTRGSEYHGQTRNGF